MGDVLRGMWAVGMALLALVLVTEMGTIIGPAPDSHHGPSGARAAIASRVSDHPISAWSDRTLAAARWLRRAG